MPPDRTAVSEAAWIYTLVADTREERDAAVDTESGAFELVSSLLPH